MPLPPLTGFELASLEIEGGGDPIDCWFNPKEYTIAKQNQWKVDPVVGTALPSAQFGGGQPRKLTLQLLFDSTDSQSLDVSDVTQQLFNMMEVRPRSAPGPAETAAGRRWSRSSGAASSRSRPSPTA